MSPAVERLIKQAIEQGHSRSVDDQVVLSVVAVVLSSAVPHREGGRHDRKLAA